MSDLKDIEDKIEALQAEIQAEVAAQEAAPEVTPEVAPQVVAPKGTISPIVQMAIDQAAERLKRETGK
jgi:hypothetical protein